MNISLDDYKKVILSYALDTTTRMVNEIIDSIEESSNDEKDFYFYICARYTLFFLETLLMKKYDSKLSHDIIAYSYSAIYKEKENNAWHMRDKLIEIYNSKEFVDGFNNPIYDIAKECQTVLKLYPDIIINSIIFSTFCSILSDINLINEYCII